MSWAGDDDNDLRAHAKAQGDFIFLCIVQMSTDTDRAQLEDMRQANVEQLSVARMYGSQTLPPATPRLAKMEWSIGRTDQAPLMRHVENDGVLRRLSMKRSVSSLLAQRPDAQSRNVDQKQTRTCRQQWRRQRQWRCGERGCTGAERCKEEEKNREKNKLLKKMSSLQLPTFVRYGEQRRFEEDDA